MNPQIKILRTDQELECPYIDNMLREKGYLLVLLPDNVILFPHLTFHTAEAMRRLEQETLQRCFEVLGGQPVLIKSRDPRLLGQEHGVIYG